MKNILVIGGNGYIGSRLIYDLYDKYSIDSIDLCWFTKQCEYNQVKDYRDLTRKELSKYSAIILLAGHSSVKMCDGPATSSWNNNVNNFVDLVRKIDKNQTLIYASSGSVYGLSNTLGKEDDVLRFKPINNYDLTKYTLDTHAEFFIKEGYNIIGLRFGTVNGWSPNTREELMINSMAKKSLYEKEIFVNNKNIKRPILGIQDISLAIDKILNNPVSGIYNLASFSDSVENISLQVSKTFKSEIIETVNYKGIYDFDMDTSKFQKIFDFKFQATIENIIDDIVKNIDKASFTNRNKFINYE